MVSVTEKEKQIEKAFEDSGVSVSVETHENEHNRNLVHEFFTFDDGRRTSGQIISSFDEPLDQEKLQYTVDSFDALPEGSDDTVETYGDTEGL